MTARSVSRITRVPSTRVWQQWRLGIQMLEVHVTFSREMFGPDVPASITTAELQQLVEGIRFIEKMMTNPVDKEEMARDIEALRSTFTKSIVARKDISAGTV